MKLIRIDDVKENMPQTMFTAEELSTFIRKAVLVCVAATVLNGVAIFLVTCSQKKSDKALQDKITANGQIITDLNTTVTNDIEADSKWREQLGIANPKLVTPKVIQPTPEPIPKESKVVPKTPPPTIIVFPQPTPVVKERVVVKRVKSKAPPTPTPYKFFQWGPKSRNTR